MCIRDREKGFQPPGYLRRRISFPDLQEGQGQRPALLKQAAVVPLRTAQIVLRRGAVQKTGAPPQPRLQEPLPGDEPDPENRPSEPGPDMGGIKGPALQHERPAPGACLLYTSRCV